MATLMRMPGESQEGFQRRATVWYGEVIEVIKLKPLELVQFDKFFVNAVSRGARCVSIDREQDRVYFASGHHGQD